MLGDREAVVTEVKPFDLHGVTYYEALILLRREHAERTAWSGGCARRLKAGDRVLVTMAGNMVVSLRRP